MPGPLVGARLRAAAAGERLSLAITAVLFLVDEMPEFSAQVLGTRCASPLETGEVADRPRAITSLLTPPASCWWGAMNPCAAGAPAIPRIRRKRGPDQRCAAEYQGRLSARCSTALICTSKSRGHRRRPDPAAAGRRQPRGRRPRGAQRVTSRPRAMRVGIAPHVRTNAQANGPLLEQVTQPTPPAWRCYAMPRRLDAFVGARLSSGIAGRPHARRSRQCRQSRPSCIWRGSVLLRAHRRSAQSGLGGNLTNK